MPNSTHYHAEVGHWFRLHRQGYEWPMGNGRKASEDDISGLLHQIQDAVIIQDSHALAKAMVNIHRWKTRNRQNQTDKYENALESQPANYVSDLLAMAPFKSTASIQRVLDHLKIQNCNLPVCTAIASFLYGRLSVTIVDRFLSLFFSRHCKATPEDQAIFRYVRYIPFVLESPGLGKLRLAVYNQRNYQQNRDIYVRDFLQECSDVANELDSKGVTFIDVDGVQHQFTPIDVEMAIFAWCSKHSNLF